MAILTQEQLNAIAKQSGYTGGTFSNVELATTPQISNSSLGLPTAPVSVLSSNTGGNIVNQNTEAIQKIENGYMGPSIVDYLKSGGQASDFDSRTALAAQQGIQNYTGTAVQNTQLLNTLRNISGSSTSGAMVDGINKSMQGGGMTSSEQQGYKDLMTSQDAVAIAAAKAKAALEAKDYRGMDYWTAKAEENKKLYEEQLSTYYEDTKSLRDSLTSAMVPGAKEQELGKQLIDIRGQAERFKLQTEQDKFDEYEGQTLSFAGGRAAGIDIKASFKNQEFALKEKNLLLSLGLEQNAREMQGKSIEQQLSYIAKDFELQQNIQDKLDAQEESLFNKADKLQGDAKNSLISILNELQGVDPKALDAQSLAQLETLAARSGIPFNLVTAALQTQYAKQVFDQSMELAQERRLGEKDTDTTTNRVSQVLDGFVTFDELTPTERQKVRDELYAKGLMERCLCQIVEV